MVFTIAPYSYLSCKAYKLSDQTSKGESPLSGCRVLTRVGACMLCTSTVVFDVWDVDSDGFISKSEFKDMMQSAETVMSPEKIQGLFSTVAYAAAYFASTLHVIGLTRSVLRVIKTSHNFGRMKGHSRILHTGFKFWLESARCKRSSTCSAPTI